MSTVVTSYATHIAGEIYTMTMHSLDSYGNVLDASGDIYSVQLTRSDGIGSEQMTNTAIYQSAGLYQT